MKFTIHKYLTFPFKIGVKVKLNEIGLATLAQRSAWTAVGPKYEMYQRSGIIIGYNIGTFSTKIYISILWENTNLDSYFYTEELEII